MTPIQELALIDEKLKKNAETRKRLYKKREKAWRKAEQVEREEAEGERRDFVHNMQVHRFPNLLKRSRPASDDHEMCAAVFQHEDLLPQIVVYLGPMEYYLFSRTSKQMVISLKHSFPIWATIFLDRLALETVGPVGFDTQKNLLLELLEPFRKQRDAEMMPMMLSLWHSYFQRYRPHGTMKECLSTTISVYSTVFVENIESCEITRLAEHNLFLAKQSHKKLKSYISNRLEKKYHSDLSQGKRHRLDYFRYNDLNRLELDMVLDKDSTTFLPQSCLYLVEPVERTIEPLMQGHRLWIYDLSNAWKGRLFCDEYECKCQIRGIHLPPVTTSYKEVAFLLS